MRSALYYPDTAVSGGDLVKSSLLLWDRLWHMAPWPNFKPKYESFEIAQAMEVIGAEHVINDEDRARAHTEIQKLVEGPIPGTVFIDPRRRNFDIYELYPEKLFPETWKLLQAHRLVGLPSHNADPTASEPIGLTLMSIIADCCAGQTLRRVTNEGEAYAAITNLFARENTDAVGQSEPAYEELVSLSLPILDLSGIDTQQLIEFRKREDDHGGHNLTVLRHKYVDALESYVTAMTNPALTRADMERLKRQFESEMVVDHKDLLEELQIASKEAIFKDIIVPTLAAMGTAIGSIFGFVAPIAGVFTLGGSVAKISGLLATSNSFYGSRREILRRHPMAYLYEARSSLKL